MIRVDVGGDCPYPVVIASGWEGLGDHVPRAPIVVTDERVGPLWARQVAAGLPWAPVAQLVVSAGEAHKTLAAWGRLVEQIVDAGADRGTPILAVGGGVVSDMAGFAAATALRGLPWVVAPTTLLAMVDAAIGGKTGVNLAAGKNLVGAFHPPRAVWAGVTALSTLPPIELACGWGEVIKTALVGDAELLDELAAVGAGVDELLPIIARCAAVKARIVTEDPNEHGVRLGLNAGHTVGHAIETASGGVVPHGEAVAMGLVAEARFAVRTGVCVDRALPERLASLARQKGLRTQVPDIDAARLLAAMRVDKKGAADKIRLPLPERAGRVIVVELPRSQLPDLLVDA